MARSESKEAESSEKPAEAQDATEKPKEGEKPAAEDEDTEMKDATETPAAKEATADSAAPPADGETTAANTAAETPAAKGRNNRRKSTGGAGGKTLSKKASKARLTHLDAKPGDHFLVKLKGFPAWPAIICDESMLPQALVVNRPVTAARRDGTYNEAYADGGKRVNDRSFPVMYLYTNELYVSPETMLMLFLTFSTVAGFPTHPLQSLPPRRPPTRSPRRCARICEKPLSSPPRTTPSITTKTS
jgi:hypothetical protein